MSFVVKFTLDGRNRTCYAFNCDSVAQACERVVAKYGPGAVTTKCTVLKDVI